MWQAVVMNDSKTNLNILETIKIIVSDYAWQEQFRQLINECALSIFKCFQCVWQEITTCDNKMND